jgi:hypothetical protein
LSLPAQGTQTLWQDWVGVVVASKHPVRVHGAQVLDLQFEERFGQKFGIAELGSKGIYECESASVSNNLNISIHTCFEFKFAAENIHQQFDKSVHGRQGVREQEKADHDRLFVVESKGLV